MVESLFEITCEIAHQENPNTSKSPKIMRIIPLFAAVCIAAISAAPPYLDESRQLEERVEDALSRMTLQEKIAMCHARSKFSSAGVPRLGIPENWMTDGPHGIRPEVLWDEWDQAGWTNDSCTAFPALTCLAATWNRDMAALYGRSIGEEARYRNKNVLLGPGVNIYRTPLNGRNFEYMGEDPYLAGRMVIPYIQGVQSNGIAACVKHFALNNQEADRNNINVSVDDRTLNEIYLPAFRAAVVEGGAWAVMGAYNRYRGQWLCQNEYLLDSVLRSEWSFDGVVVSDWGGVNNTREAVMHGIDMEFGTWTDGMTWGVANAYDNYHLAAPFRKMIESGEVSEAVLDEKVRRILRLAFRTTMNTRRPFGSFASPEHFHAARKIAEEGIVLLKNDGGVLPLLGEQRILVVGENAVKAMTVGGGSSSLKAAHEISPLDGLRTRFPEVVWARGYVGDVSGDYNGVSSGQNLAETRTPDQLLEEAVSLARDADAVVFIGGLNKSAGQDCEGADRKSLALPYGQDAIIAALARANRRLVVVNVSGNAVAMPWIASVPAVVQTWYNGSEAGTALASILAGDVNPSGKLPFTFPRRLEDCGAHAVGDYPGAGGEQTYREGIFVGYRWTDHEGITPLFPFGHGLSYTSFEYSKPHIVAAGKGSFTVSMEVRNTGSRTGAEVVQLYIRDVRSSLPRPVKELKGFEKVMLAAGESKTVTFAIDRSSLSYFDDQRRKWVVEPGTFEALVGSSASDIRGRAEFEL